MASSSPVFTPSQEAVDLSSDSDGGGRPVEVDKFAVRDVLSAVKSGSMSRLKAVWKVRMCCG